MRSIWIAVINKQGGNELRTPTDMLAFMKIETRLQGEHKRLSASRQSQEFGCKN